MDIWIRQLAVETVGMWGHSQFLFVCPSYCVHVTLSLRQQKTKLSFMICFNSQMIHNGRLCHTTCKCFFFCHSLSTHVQETAISAVRCLCSARRLCLFFFFVVNKTWECYTVLYIVYRRFCSIQASGRPLFVTLHCCVIHFVCIFQIAPFKASEWLWNSYLIQYKQNCCMYTSL